MIAGQTGFVKDPGRSPQKSGTKSLQVRDSWDEKIDHQKSLKTDIGF